MIKINGIKWVQMKFPGIFGSCMKKRTLYFGNAVSCTPICFFRVAKDVYSAFHK
jgi:hypothetical protein